jgi:hypothetical protein
MAEQFRSKAWSSRPRRVLVLVLIGLLALVAAGLALVVVRMGASPGPTVSSFTLVSSSPTNAGSVSWQVVFSTSVTGVAASVFSLLQSGGVSGAGSISVSGSGSTYTVSASTGSGNGTLALNLSSAGSIEDSSNHGLQGAPYPGPWYRIDKTKPAAPVLTQTPPDPSATASSTFRWTDASTDVASYLCSKENGAFVPCPSGTPPYTFTVSTSNNGRHRFAVEAVDLAGNVSGSASYDWKVDKGAQASPTIAQPPIVNRKPAVLSTVASGPVTVGSSITDVATLTAPFGAPAAGTVTFNVYAGSDSSCSSPLNGSPLATATRTGGSSPTYTSEGYAPADAGVYKWVATFAGDANNASTTGTCGAPTESSTVNKANPANPAITKYTISGVAPNRLSPGTSAQPIPVSLDSPNSGNGGGGVNGTRVSNLTVSIGSVTGGGPGPNPCTAADFQITQIPAAAYPFYIPFGASTLASIIGAANLPKIRMIDRQDSHPGDGSGNQDACKGATIHLSYAGTP